MRQIAFAIFVSLSAVTGAFAESARLVVLELFTSQGCSSCPPADALLTELTGHEGVLPLALHVDYWDYIGWADEFARPEHTRRQKAYARMAQAGSIYTPQIVIGGVDHVVGFKPMEVAELLARHRAEPPRVRLKQAQDGVLYVTRAAGVAEFGTSVDVELVYYTPEEVVKIHHGENAGKTITYSNIVTQREHIGRWDGTAPFEFTVPASTGESAALVLQTPGPGPVLAAFRLH